MKKYLALGGFLFVTIFLFPFGVGLSATVAGTKCFTLQGSSINAWTPIQPLLANNWAEAYFQNNLGLWPDHWFDALRLPTADQTLTLKVGSLTKNISVAGYPSSYDQVISILQPAVPTIMTHLVQDFPYPTVSCSGTFEQLQLYSTDMPSPLLMSYQATALPQAYKCRDSNHIPTACMYEQSKLTLGSIFSAIQTSSKNVVGDEDAVISVIDQKKQANFAFTYPSNHNDHVTFGNYASNCVKLSGNGPKKIVFMRGNGITTGISDFLWHVTDIIDYGFKKIDPFKTYFSQFSFYVDLKKRPDNDVSKGSCGVDAAYYINLFDDTSGNLGLAGDRQVHLNIHSGGQTDYSLISSNAGALPINQNLPRAAIRGIGSSILKNESPGPSSKSFGTISGSGNLGNCSLNPNVDYKNAADGKIYGSLSEKGCGGYFGTSETSPYYRPSHSSIMNGALNDPSISQTPDINKFNVVSCGYLISSFRGEELTQTNAASHFAECKTLDTAKSDPCSNPADLKGEKPNILQNYMPTDEHKYSDTFKDLTNHKVTDITENNVKDWVNNDVWDLSGGQEQIKAYISQQQDNEYTTIRDKDRQMNSYPTYDDVVSMKNKYFDKKQIVMGGIYFMSGGFHAVTFLDANIYSPVQGEMPWQKIYSYDFAVIDPNRPAQTIIYNCKDRYDFDKVTKTLWCISPDYGGEHITISQFVPSLTDKLIAAKALSCPRKGDLCGKTARDRAVEFNESLSGNGFKNWGIASSKDGVCSGWSITLMREAYLANFIGDSTVDKEETACLSAVMGESKTATCNDNKSACHVSWGTEYALPSGRVSTNVWSEFGFCGYLNKSNANVSLPGYNFIGEFGVKDLGPCDGKTKYLVANPSLANWRLPIRFWYTPKDEVVKYTYVNESGKPGFFSRLWTGMKKTYQSALALLSLGSSGPSCTTNVSESAFTYQKGYIFSHPSRVATAADYAAVDTSGFSETFKNLYRLWMSDVVYVPGSDIAWYWPLGATNPVSVPLDEFTRGYLSSFRTWQTEQGINDNCKLTAPLPSRFSGFLSAAGVDIPAAAPSLNFTSGNPTIMIPRGSSYPATWTSTSLSTTTVVFKLLKGGNNYLNAGEPVQVSVPNAGTLTSGDFPLPNNLPEGSDYSIKASILNGDDLDDSPVFTVTDPSAPVCKTLGAKMATGSDGKGFIGCDVEILSSFGYTGGYCIGKNTGKKTNLVPDGYGRANRYYAILTGLDPKEAVKVFVQNQSKTVMCSPILNNDPALTVTNPVAGTTYNKGTTAAVKWTSLNIDSTKPVLVRLLKNGKDVAKDASGALAQVKVKVGDGKADFPLPEFLISGSDYTFRLEVDTNLVTASTKSFTIRDDPNKPITYLSGPGLSASDSYLPGTSAVVKWKSVGLDPKMSMYVQLMRNGQDVMDDDVRKLPARMTTTVGAGSINFNFIDGLAVGSGYSLRLQTSGGQKTYSGIFSLKDPTQTLTVTSNQNAGAMYKGKTYNITWTSKNIAPAAKVGIWLQKGGMDLPSGPGYQNGFLVPNTGTYALTIPNEDLLQNATDYSLRFSLDGTTLATTQRFTIDSTPLTCKTLGTRMSIDSDGSGYIGCDILADGKFDLKNSYCEGQQTGKKTNLIADSGTANKYWATLTGLNSKETVKVFIVSNIGQRIECLPALNQQVAGSAANSVNAAKDSVSTATKSLTITDDPKGATLARGRNYTLTWNSTGISATTTITILSQKGGKTLLQATTPNTGSYRFTVPTNALDGSDYSMTIVAPDGTQTSTSLFSVGETEVDPKPSAGAAVFQLLLPWFPF